MNSTLKQQQNDLDNDQQANNTSESPNDSITNDEQYHLFIIPGLALLFSGPDLSMCASVGTRDT